MSADFWAVIGTAVAVLVAITAQGRDLRRRMERLETRIDVRFDAVNQRSDAVNERLDDVSGWLSPLEGHFEEMGRWSKDLVEALVRRPAA
ncbi:MAG: hypothetical protein ACHQ7M_02560 [Chloroflexota bacterium]